LKVLIISGSQQVPSNSWRLTKHLEKQWANASSGVQIDTMELARYPELLSHYGPESDQYESLYKSKDHILSRLYDADAVVIVTPEWGGMLPPALTNLFLMTAFGSASGFPLAHKPALAVGISASGGGANPITLLRAYAGKNSHLCWLPNHAIVQNIEQFLSSPWTPNQKDRISNVQARLDVGFNSLLAYSRQLKPVRSQLTEQLVSQPYGQ